MASSLGSPTPVESLEWVRFAATIITPFAVLWLGILFASRRKLREAADEKLEDLTEKLERLSGQINMGREECREDINALRAQLAGFQRDVAERYPPRREYEDGLKGIREEIRFLFGRRGEHDDPDRRR